MNEPKFTPGPWVLDLDTFEDGYAYIETPTGRAVALVDEVRKADLDLMAAAPDLLEALQSIAREPREQSLEYGAKSLRDKARAAIKKATGEE